MEMKRILCKFSLDGEEIVSVQFVIFEIHNKVYTIPEHEKQKFIEARHAYNSDILIWEKKDIIQEWLIIRETDNKVYTIPEDGEVDFNEAEGSYNGNILVWKKMET